MMSNIYVAILAFITALLIIWCCLPTGSLSGENFDQDMREFVPFGCQRYGLRGDLLHTGSVARNYIDNNRQIVLNPTSGEMWEANWSPEQEKMLLAKNCKNVPCPANHYDEYDKCAICGNADYDMMKIPDIHPHVPN